MLKRFQSGVMETGQEKVDSREKSLNDENKELKHQIISLQRNLEEKDARIRELELKVKTQMNNLYNASTQVSWEKHDEIKHLQYIHYMEIFLDVNFSTPCARRWKIHTR